MQENLELQQGIYMRNEQAGNGYIKKTRKNIIEIHERKMKNMKFSKMEILKMK